MCTGDEDSLLDCVSGGGSFGSHDCTHSEDAGVRCESKESIQNYRCDFENDYNFYF